MHRPIKITVSYEILMKGNKKSWDDVFTVADMKINGNLPEIKQIANMRKDAVPAIVVY